VRLTHVGLLVDDLDAAVSDLRAGGAERLGEPQDRRDLGIRVAYFRDAAGNLLEVNHQVPSAE
jgi:catechol 2,3-dioxygenase-like lactoylglutathione lyase family enzyme